jgi:hypothetical protein
MTKHIITAIICAVFIQFSFSQTTINRTAGVTYTNGVPTADPGARGSLIAVDVTTWREYEWNAGNSTWVHRGFFIQEISGCATPAFTPGLHDSYYQKSIGCKSLWIWNGTSWDLSGDDWGDQTINTLSPLSGKGTSGKPLTIGQAGATNGQVLKWNSTTSAWEPANDNNTGTTYTGGTGINVTGSVISNTGDLSNTNELQTLSTGTNTLTLSGGGGTVTVDTDPTNDVTGSGTATRLAYWSGTSVLTSTANLLWDNTNTRLSVGAGASPSDALHVNGTGRFSNLAINESGGWFGGAKIGVKASGSGSLQLIFRGYASGGSTRFGFDIDASDRGAIGVYGTGGANPIIFTAGGDSYMEGFSIRLAIGHTSPTSRLDIDGANGYTQLRLRDTYTPTSSADVNGQSGDIAHDANYIYIKTSGGWKRAALSTF